MLQNVPSAAVVIDALRVKRPTRLDVSYQSSAFRRFTQFFFKNSFARKYRSMSQKILTAAITDSDYRRCSALNDFIFLDTSRDCGKHYYICLFWIEAFITTGLKRKVSR